LGKILLRAALQSETSPSLPPEIRT
jgi:hypothetical protein